MFKALHRYFQGCAQRWNESREWLEKIDRQKLLLEQNENDLVAEIDIASLFCPWENDSSLDDSDLFLKRFFSKNRAEFINELRDLTRNGSFLAFLPSTLAKKKTQTNFLAHFNHIESLLVECGEDATLHDRFLRLKEMDRFCIAERGTLIKAWNQTRNSPLLPSLSSMCGPLDTFLAKMVNVNEGRRAADFYEAVNAVPTYNEFFPNRPRPPRGNQTNKEQRLQWTHALGAQIT